MSVKRRIALFCAMTLLAAAINGSVAGAAPSRTRATRATTPEPRTFLAAIGAGHERVAVVNTRSGKRGPFLTAPSQLLDRFSYDSKTIYVPKLSGCGRIWYAIDIASGSKTRVYQELGTPNDVVPSPDGKYLAYVVPVNCGGEELVVRDVTTGHERRWTAPASRYPDDTVTQLNWSWDSTRLTYVLFALRSGKFSESAWVLGIHHGRRLTDGVRLAPSNPKCTIDVPRFRAGTSDIVAAENCTNRSATLESFDARTGARGAVIHRVTGPNFGIVDLSIDRSGQHLLYILSASTGEVFALRGDHAALLLTDAYQVFW